MRPRLSAVLLAALSWALVGSLPTAAADWYVSPAGSDTNSGVQSRPFRTWQKAIDRAQPGDIVHLARGRYELRGSRAVGVSITRSGARGMPIRLLGDGAVLDCSAMTRRGGVSCLRISADWWVISGISVTGARQRSQGAWSIGVEIVDASNNLIADSRAYRNEGPGFRLTGESLDNRLTSCVAYDNFDPRTNPPGGNADGFQITRIPPSATGNRISSALSISNSDDGFDLWRAEAPVVIENSVASRNGFVARGDGIGFKLGENRLGPPHVIRDNLAQNNRCDGFSSNNASGPAQMVRNRSRGNGVTGC